MSSIKVGPVQRSLGNIGSDFLKQRGRKKGRLKLRIDVLLKATLTRTTTNASDTSSLRNSHKQSLNKITQPTTSAGFKQAPFPPATHQA